MLAFRSKMASGTLRMLCNLLKNTECSLICLYTGSGRLFVIHAYTIIIGYSSNPINPCGLSCSAVVARALRSHTCLFRPIFGFRRPTFFVLCLVCFPRTQFFICVDLSLPPCRLLRFFEEFLDFVRVFQNFLASKT